MEKIGDINKWKEKLYISHLEITPKLDLTVNYFVTCFFATLLYIAFLVNKYTSTTSFNYMVLVLLDLS